jgi:hypothetical protein
MAMGCWGALRRLPRRRRSGQPAFDFCGGKHAKEERKQRTADAQEGLQIGKGGGDRADLLCLLLFSFLFLYRS